ncbi:MAG: beta-galactosidase [Phycisphaerae bacterium]|nr:beta-galactosidase [Phycisphaerae bacterium]
MIHYRIIALLMFFSPLSLWASVHLEVGPEKSFPTLQAAVDAIPDVLREPYFITIAPGRYRESVVLRGKKTSAVNRITVRGDHSNRPILQPEGKNACAMTLREQNFVILENLECRQSRGYGNLFLDRSHHNVIRRCVLAEAKPYDGLCLSGSTDNTIEHCVFDSNERSGVQLLNSSKGNRLHFNLFVKNSVGIAADIRYPATPVFNDWNAYWKNQADTTGMQPGPGSLRRRNPKFQNTRAGDGFLLAKKSPVRRWGIHGDATADQPSPTTNREDPFFSVDLTPAATRSVRDDVSADGKGGWTDQGDYDLRTLPKGMTVLRGIPFQLPSDHRDVSIVILKGKNTRSCPNTSVPIPIGKKALNLSFLHACAWAQGREVMKYRVTYADGQSVDIPVVRKANIDDWWNPEPLEQAKVGFSVPHPDHPHVHLGLYLYTWKNPYPFKTIRSLTAISADLSTPILVAVTGRTYTDDQSIRLNVFTSSPRVAYGKAARISVDAFWSKPLEAKVRLIVTDASGRVHYTSLPKTLPAKQGLGPTISFDWKPPARDCTVNYKADVQASSDGKPVACETMFLTVRGKKVTETKFPALPVRVEPGVPLGGRNLLYGVELQPLRQIHRNRFQAGERPKRMPPEMFDNLKKSGATVAHLVCWWSYLEPREFEYDFHSIEYALKQCRRVGLQASISVWMGDHNVPEFCRHENMVDQNGRQFLGGRSRHQGQGYAPSIWGPTSRKHFTALIRQIAKRYLRNPTVVAWGFMYQHVEVTIHDRRGSPPVLYDYSPWATKKYRRYLQDVRGFSLKTLHRRYDTKYRNWNEVEQPKAKEGLDVSLRWSDFQDFRVYSVREAFDLVFRTVREVDPQGRKILFTFNPHFAEDVCRRYNVACDYTGSEPIYMKEICQAFRLAFDQPMIVEPTSIPPGPYEINAGFFNSFTTPVQGYLWVGTVRRGMPPDAPAAVLFRDLRDSWVEMSQTEPFAPSVAVLTSQDTGQALHKVIRGYTRTDSPLLNRLVYTHQPYEPIFSSIFSVAEDRFTRQYKLILDTDSRVMRTALMKFLKRQVSDGATLIVNPDSGTFCRENPKTGKSLLGRLEFSLPANHALKRTPACNDTFRETSPLLPGRTVRLKSFLSLEGLEGTPVLSTKGRILARIKPLGSGRVVLLAGPIDWQRGTDAGLLDALDAYAGVIKPLEVESESPVRAAMMRKDDVVYILLFNESQVTYRRVNVTPNALMPGTYNVIHVTDGFSSAGTISVTSSKRNIPMFLAPNELRIYKLTPVQ